MKTMVIKTRAWKPKQTNFAIGLTVFFGWLLLSMPLLAQRNDNEVTKTFEKTYANISPGLEVEISNKFGEVKINTTNLNVLKVKVEIKAWARNADKAQEILESIEIEHSMSGDQASFETEIDGGFSVNNRSGFEINYEVTMPETSPLDLENKYGEVYLGDHRAELSLEVGYGQLHAGKLMGPDTNIEASYGGVEIEEIANGDLEVKYCKFVEIEKAGILNVEDKYGKTEIGEVDELEIEIAYSKLQIGRVNRTLEIESKYAGGDIESISPDFESIDVETSYGSYDMDVSDASNFSFAVSVRYGSFNGNNDLDIRKQYKKHASGEYEGVKGRGGNQKINVSASYGSVNFR